MKITLTHEFDSADAAVAFLRRATGPAQDDSIRGPDMQPEAPPPKKRGRPRKIEAPAEPAPVGPSVEPAPVGPSVASGTYEQAQQVLDQVFKAKGLVTARNLLARYGGTRLRDLKPEQYAAMIDEAQRLLADEASDG